MIRSKALLALSIALSATCLSSPAFAAFPQGYPAKPLRMVVPFEAGTYTDLVARLVAKHMAERLTTPVVVENRAGAGGNIGAEEVARAPADGYTLLFSSVATHGINPSLYKNLRYDAQRDFAPVSLVMKVPNVIVVNPQLPVQNLKEFIAYGKANPGKLEFGSAGTGTSQHLTGEMFKSLTGVDMLHVPYKGSQAALVDLMGGRIQVSVQNLPVVQQHILDGKLKGLVLTSEKRSEMTPSVPTGKEAGVPGLVATSWSGVWMRAGTSAEVVDGISKEIQAIVKLPELQSYLRQGGAEAVGDTPEQFKAFVATEIAKWRAAVVASGAKLD